MSGLDMLGPMETNPPAHSKGRELTQTAIEAIVNLVPAVGSTITVLLMAGLNHKLNQRRERWLTELAEAVEELSRSLDGFDPDALVDNDAFVDAVMTATQTVFRTSQQDKIEVLRNAVLNSAMPGAPDLDIQQLFFDLIDRLTPTHMRLLALLNDPPGWFDRHPELTRPTFSLSSNRVQLISAALPDLGAQGQAIIERFFAPLADGGLVNGSIHGMMTAAGAWQPMTTDHASAFLAFIRDPR
ncbi:hypothetical protein HD597_012865 [Nonomuraea thailandensis]|uniref:Uncharacterized protein n=1 Tax=Nonomuraea thailandensis TaxID=1188745 RepID=A0A9X2H1P6_9ACTN|nr:hypothetical protein [Nonomuraea thailandensis]MCP2365761.1 hypothetical protein [Nonomuraea thailandensis]